jgi:uncharacterized membrane protein
MPVGAAWSLSPVLARVLGWGARLSVLVLGVGLALVLAAGGHSGTVMKPDALLAALRRGQGAGILGVGIVLLIATPVMREIVAMTMLFRHRERTLGGIACLVLVLVLIALVVGAR